jgi:hypothetical protein
MSRNAMKRKMVAGTNKKFISLFASMLFYLFG